MLDTKRQHKSIPTVLIKVFCATKKQLFQDGVLTRAICNNKNKNGADPKLFGILRRSFKRFVKNCFIKDYENKIGKSKACGLFCHAFLQPDSLLFFYYYHFCIKQGSLEYFRRVLILFSPQHWILGCAFSNKEGRYPYNFA